MKKRLLISVVLWAWLVPEVGLLAQKAYINAGRIILDMSTTGEGIGMNTNSVTNESKTIKYQGYTAIPGQYLYGTTRDKSYEENEKVYEKLEIAPRDMGTGTSLVAVGQTSPVMTWETAFNQCKSLIHNGNNWRLPTDREHIMMYLFRNAIVELGGAAWMLDNYYWNATEPEMLYAGRIDFKTGAKNGIWKSYAYHVRCVREVTP